ncbi:dihydroxyacetone kinase [Phlyctema vagabunda]|uniref:Dihydroxyacetone kinase n=1 Tax=Phlyctema vagabunda TaxID=108571 RepID=A0ABR4P4V3_9HELO
MSLVVEQTLPYKPSELQLDDAQRWARLLPLIRPSIRIFQKTGDNAIAIDTSLATSRQIPLAVIGAPGAFSSKILEVTKVAALVIQEAGQSIQTHPEAIFDALKQNGFELGKGLIILGNAPKSAVVTFDSGAMKVDVESAFQFDHVLSLLSSSKDEVQTELRSLEALLKDFVASYKSTRSMLHERKSGSGPSISHALDTAEFNSAKAAVDKDLSHLLASSQASKDDTNNSNVVYSVHFSDINGLSRLENNILIHEVSEYFERRGLPSHITHSSILDRENLARGWEISVASISQTFLGTRDKPKNTLANSNIAETSAPRPHEVTSKIQYSDMQVRKIITAGCEKVIASEAIITEYDTIVGDGDCGYTLRDGAKQVMSFIGDGDRDLSQLPHILCELVDGLEVNMGGTSGALYCIFISALAQSLCDALSFPSALRQALGHLLMYTRARLGDRTCLDCLIPFIETLVETGSSEKALEDAILGVESTKKLEAKLGRSSYLDESATRGVPDPGAYGLLMLLEGMVGAK